MKCALCIIPEVLSVNLGRTPSCLLTVVVTGDLGRRVVMLGDGLYWTEGLGWEEGPAPPHSIASSVMELRPGDTKILSTNKTKSRNKMSLITRKPVFGVCNQGKHKPTCTATEAR